MEIDPNISSDEVLIRCMKHPVHYKKKVKLDVFLPPPKSSDVSLLRLKYTDLHFCKTFSVSLNSNGFTRHWGLGALLSLHVDEVNADPQVEINASIVCSPIDTNGQYIDNVESVTTQTPGIPMHADLKYEKIFEKGNPNTDHRVFAKKLVDKILVKEDSQPNEDSWCDGDFMFD